MTRQSSSFHENKSINKFTDIVLILSKCKVLRRRKKPVCHKNVVITGGEDDAEGGGSDGDLPR